MITTVSHDAIKLAAIGKQNQTSNKRNYHNFLKKQSGMQRAETIGVQKALIIVGSRISQCLFFGEAQQILNFLRG